MKRSRIKRKPRPRREEGDSLLEYRKNNPQCEADLFLKRHPQALAWKQSLGLSRWARRVEIDHLWGGTGGRVDLTSMMISVSTPWHEWKTANFTQGLVFFLIVKSMKRPQEINAKEFRACSGMSLHGYLSLDKTVSACPAWMAPYISRIIKMCEDDDE